MPKSKRRKLPFRTRVEKAKRLATEDKLAEARRVVYGKALPKFQDYPIQHEQKEYKSDHLSYLRIGSRAISFYASKDMKPGQIIRMSNRTYEVQRDGSLRRVREEKELKKAA